ncbi:MAG: histidine kinase dimerization/phosphoacceptor domain -containing protein [Candidatus Aminicenantales bacterium]
MGTGSADGKPRGNIRYWMDIDACTQAKEEWKEPHGRHEETGEECPPAEKALRESEERFKLLFDFAPDAYYLNDLKGNFIDGNRAAEELLGCKKKDLIGQSFLTLRILSESQVPKAAELLAKNALQQPTGPDEFILNHRDGSQVAVEIRTYPVHFKGQSFVLGIARDITKRQQAEKKLRESLLEKEALLKEIQHRVKNNMQVILSILNLQARQCKDPVVNEVFRKTQNRIRSIALVHENLYRFKDMSRIDISEYIHGLAIHLFHSYHVDTDLVRFKPEIARIYMDINTAIPCGLIVNELVSNALKHAFLGKRRGEVCVHLSPFNHHQFELVIRDNGIGFPNIIDFKKTETLGLQIVMTLVDQLDGTIELARKKGTEFTLIFNELKYRQRF